MIWGVRILTVRFTAAEDQPLVGAGEEAVDQQHGGASGVANPVHRQPVAILRVHLVPTHVHPFLLRHLRLQHNKTSIDNHPETFLNNITFFIQSRMKKNVFSAENFKLLFYDLFNVLFSSKPEGQDE